MTQAVALSTALVGQAEDLGDTWKAAWADGYVCDGEAMTLTTLIVDVTSLAGIVDLAQATGLAVIRRGADAKRSAELMGQLMRHQPAPEPVGY